MTKQQSDLINTEHREALALAVFEALQALGTLANRTFETIRLEMEDITKRTMWLQDLEVRPRYVAIRGFDPREVRSAPKLRWL